MRYGAELLDLPRVEKIRKKRTPGYIKPEHFSRRHPVNPLVLESSLQSQIDLPHLKRVLEEFPEEKRFLSRFINGHGPQAVKNALEDTLRGVPDLVHESQEAYNKIIKTATGVVYERIAHLHIRDTVRKTSSGKKNVLDPGSVSRVFSSLHQRYRLTFTPDGAIISDLRNINNQIPTLYGLYEYKMSADKDFDDLKGQIEKMREFRKRFAGDTLDLNTQIDKRFNKRKNRKVRIAEDLTITVVTSPNHALNNEQISEFQDIEFVNTPFPGMLVVKLAIASMLDFMKIPPQQNSRTA